MCTNTENLKEAFNNLKQECLNTWLPTPETTFFKSVIDRCFASAIGSQRFTQKIITNLNFSNLFQILEKRDALSPKNVDVLLILAEEYKSTTMKEKVKRYVKDFLPERSNESVVQNQQQVTGSVQNQQQLTGSIVHNQFQGSCLPQRPNLSVHNQSIDQPPRLSVLPNINERLAMSVQRPLVRGPHLTNELNVIHSVSTQRPISLENIMDVVGTRLGNKYWDLGIKLPRLYVGDIENIKSRNDLSLRQKGVELIKLYFRINQYSFDSACQLENKLREIRWNRVADDLHEMLNS